jgi:BlaI family penicillinase repressor
MPIPDITISEWTVMEALWKRSPQTASGVAKEVREATGWAVNTVRTLLARLTEKGAVRSKRGHRGILEFVPVVAREAWVRTESESFLNRVFKGAADSLLVHFVQHSRLSAADIKALKQIVDEAAARRG